MEVANSKKGGFGGFATLEEKLMDDESYVLGNSFIDGSADDRPVIDWSKDLKGNDGYVPSLGHFEK